VKATFPVVHDVKGTIHTTFGVEGQPTNILVDRQGKVVYAEVGAEIQAIEAAVTSAVAKK